MKPQTRANIFIWLLDHTYKAPLANVKMECQRGPEKSFILGRSGTQNVAMVTKLLSSYGVPPFVAPYCKDSNISVINWLIEVSFSIIFDQNLVKYMTSPLG